MAEIAHLACNRAAVKTFLARDDASAQVVCKLVARAPRLQMPRQTHEKEHRQSRVGKSPIVKSSSLFLLPFLAPAIVATLLTGCAREPEIRTPYQDDIVSFCTESRQPKSTAVASVLTATEDIPPTIPAESEARITGYVRGTGGVIARFDAQTAFKKDAHGKRTPYTIDIGPQLLIMPKTAALLGSPDKYVRVYRAAIANKGLVGVDVRRVFLEVAVKGGKQWLPFKAYDLQDVCNEGQRLSARVSAPSGPVASNDAAGPDRSGIRRQVRRAPRA